MTRQGKEIVSLGISSIGNHREPTGIIISGGDHRLSVRINTGIEQVCTIPVTLADQPLIYTGIAEVETDNEKYTDPDDLLAKMYQVAAAPEN